MKKILAVISAAAIIILSMSSCRDNAYKKITPDTSNNPAPIVQDNTPSKQQEPAAGTPDETSETTKPQNDDSQDNTETSVTEINPSGLSNEKISQWMPGRNKEHKVPQLNPKYKDLLDKYGGYFVGDTSSKVIYLTFDEGYENGYTGKILDILKENGVTAAFFVTKPYIKSSPDLVKRMVAEGHIVGNHSNTHPSMPDVSDERVISELNDTADYFKEITGTDMPKFFRPPMGEWSERTLYITNSLGYKTILWSMAHRDWVVDEQPGKDATIKFVDTYYHNGAILLLHAVSQSNTEALDHIIKNMKNKGYRFASLDELK